MNENLLFSAPSASRIEGEKTKSRSNYVATQINYGLEEIAACLIAMFLLLSSDVIRRSMLSQIYARIRVFIEVQGSEVVT